ncbi:adenosylcobinamide-GDP ribazoletransferase [Pseudoponticoccus marisrubri]|uniref:Adenosylcobinamide-GDP ribazoletransferase n=1 Tax=Pseudoponticoccus marisrubri TaxID=1685382 RepID=A0A0W7WLM4_9RHOB|nr:adenosylcobinamide-GDP ribazoletransferase [Pseudoponticoccus marisrubri]KUF11396.1 hypothetical protein AVJ23_06420 [Pseudoponticoccus marisrubri]
MRDAIHLEWQLFLLALRYLTRVPVPAGLPSSDDLMIRATKYHPVVGVVVGAVGAAVLWLAALVLPWGAAVILSLAATLIVTGAFHEDGLADAVDGLAGGSDRDTVLRIMADARLGKHGGMALGLVLALKLVLLASLNLPDAMAALVAGHAMGRMGAVHIIATTRYARSEGMQAIITAITPDGYRVALAMLAVLLAGMMLWFGWVATGYALVLSILLGQLFRAWFQRKLGGYTGDCLGGVQQLCELGVYLGLAIVL